MSHFFHCEIFSFCSSIIIIVLITEIITFQVLCISYFCHFQTLDIHIYRREQTVKHSVTYHEIISHLYPVK